ncbi:hypothetical protein Sjap_000300 [Stephania japonica]|uniref:Uncharacterized protein n=1 Tax=Stephania japonica TaxID=461633 RepID=A0AAP0KKC5_9MAGN
MTPGPELFHMSSAYTRVTHVTSFSERARENAETDLGVVFDRLRWEFELSRTGQNFLIEIAQWVQSRVPTGRTKRRLTIISESAARHGTRL